MHPYKRKQRALVLGFTRHTCYSALYIGTTDRYYFADDMYVCIEVVFLYSSTFCCDSASEFGAMGSTSFLGFSYPNLLLFFSELLLFLGTCITLFSQVFGLSLGLLYFSVPYFGLACDHQNSFLCLED